MSDYIYNCRKTELCFRETPLEPDREPWSGAQVMGPFIPASGRGPASFATRARMVWNDDGIIALFECEDPCVWATMEKDNAPIFDEEVVELFLDPVPDDGYYYEFELSPANVRFAALIQNPSEKGWEKIISRLDCDALKSRVEIDGALNDPQIESQGWSALLFIPFSLMDAGTPALGETWRGNLFRIDRPHPDGSTPELRHEFSCWSPTLTDPAAFHRPARFGEIKFLENAMQT